MWFLLTIVVFVIARWLSARIKSPLFNPLLISIVAIIVILMTCGVQYQTYYSQNTWVSFLLQPAVVALAYPLYEQLPQIRSHWKVVLAACTIGSALSILTGGLLAMLLGANVKLVASLMAKSVTTPIAMEVSQSIGGEPSVTAILVVICGLLGSIFAYPAYHILRIKHPVSIGLTTGCVSHALGTSACAENDPRDAAFSSLALVLCGIITSILAPIFLDFFEWLYPLLH